MVRFVDAKIWRACAGPSVQIPTVNSRVYYFPQGHLDEASSQPEKLDNRIHLKPYILCTVSAVQLLADPDTDEVFANLILNPPVGPIATAGLSRFANRADGDNDRDRFVSFAKILTVSDVTDGGEFSIPNSCAESIFPAINLQADQQVQVQVIKVTDIQGNAWEFRHDYNGTTKQHRLTTGWGNFVDNKKLVAGDSVVFMRNSTGEMFVGIRRTSSEFTLYSSDTSCYHEDPSSRNLKGKLSAETVADAAKGAAWNEKFEAVYYPKAGTGWSDFVVKTDIVEKAMNIVWSPGMRVKMAVETDDSSTTPKITWFQGIISSLVINGTRPWRGSPWRSLRIKWDQLEVEPEVLKNSKWVSPWQVEIVAPALPTKDIAPPPDSASNMTLRERLDTQSYSSSTVEDFYLG